jgi:hypothetical protein
MALVIASSGSSTSSTLSDHAFANRILNGSAFGDGIDWIMRNMVSTSATSVLYDFPSVAGNFSS